MVYRLKAIGILLKRKLITLFDDLNAIVIPVYIYIYIYIQVYLIKGCIPLHHLLVSITGKLYIVILPIGYKHTRLLRTYRKLPVIE